MSELQALDGIGERIIDYLDGKNAARDLALQRSRTMIRHCATAIRAAHRDDRDLSREHLEQARQLKEALSEELEAYPDLYHAGLHPGCVQGIRRGVDRRCVVFR